MANAGLDISVSEGQDFFIDVNPTRGVDLTAATAITFVMTPLATSSGTATLTKSLGSGIVVVSTDACTITIARTDTAGLGGNRYQFEVWVTNSDDVKAPVASGKITFTSSNTG